MRDHCISLMYKRTTTAEPAEHDRSQVFDVGAVGPQNVLALKEVAVFLTQPLPDSATALGVYVSVGGQQWQFRGYVANMHPSECVLAACCPASVCAKKQRAKAPRGHEVALKTDSAVAWGWRPQQGPI